MRRLLLLLVALTACTKDTTVLGSIGPAGGTVTASDGSRVSVPSGAVQEAVEVTITARTDAPPPPDATAVGQGYLLEPEGQQFDQPVAIELVFDPALLPEGATPDDVVVLTAPAGTDDYTPIPTALIGEGRVRAITTHFSWFVPGVFDPPPPPPPPPLGMDASADSGEPGDGSEPGEDATVERDATTESDGPVEDPDAGLWPDAEPIDAGAADTAPSDAGSCGPDGTACSDGIPGGAAGMCLNGTCVVVTCTQAGGVCGTDSDCCSGLCSAGSCAAVTDNDGDGYGSDVDCHDGDSAIHPNATELCNQVDDDCDGMADEGCCATGLTYCGGSCVDTATDPSHCTGCDRVCGVGEICNSGCMLPGP